MNLSPQVFANGVLFYVVALFFLVYLGMGITVIMLPKGLRQVGWLVIPFIGYAFLIAICSWMVAFGATVKTSLITALVIATVSNGWIIIRSNWLYKLGPPRSLLILLALSFPHYCITALSMAHNGSLAYVGGQGDLYILIPLAEWLKDHSAPLLSFNSLSILNFSWNANVPPIGEWSNEHASLGFAGHRSDDTNFLFQRGPMYLQSSLGLLLGWDSFLTFRPTQAFAFSLALPATYLFCRTTIGGGQLASILAAALLGLNGTLFHWVAFGHPGQTFGLMLFPLAVTLYFHSIINRERLPLIGCTLALSSLFISYYQGVPLLGFLLVPTTILALINYSSRSTLVIQIIIVTLAGILLIGLPEHLKLGLVWFSGTLAQTTGAGDLGITPISDALGTTLISRAFILVTGEGQVSDRILTLIYYLSNTTTLLIAAIAVFGIVLTKTAGINLLRSLLLSTFILLLGLGLVSYTYGYAKAQSSSTFLFCSTVALGIAELIKRIGSSASLWRNASGVRRAMIILFGGILLALASCMIVVNISLAIYAFWKPVGNIWNPKAWEAANLEKLIPANSIVRISPSLLTDPESYYITLYCLRNYRLWKPLVIEGVLSGNPMLLAAKETENKAIHPDVEILSVNEIVSAHGLAIRDQIWRGSQLQAFHNRNSIASEIAQTFSSKVTNGNIVENVVSTSVLPASSSIQAPSPPSNWQRLSLTLITENPAGLQISSTHDKRSLKIDLERGLNILSVPIRSEEQITLNWEGSRRIRLLTSNISEDDSATLSHENYEKALGATGKSEFSNGQIRTYIDYFNLQTPVSHSLDIFDTRGNNHVGWFQLPLNPDGQIHNLMFTFITPSMDQIVIIDGTRVDIPNSVQRLTDDEYVTYFSLWKASAVVKRIPLYRFRIENNEVVEFQSYDLTTALRILDGS